MNYNLLTRLGVDFRQRGREKNISEFSSVYLSWNRKAYINVLTSKPNQSDRYSSEDASNFAVIVILINMNPYVHKINKYIKQYSSPLKPPSMQSSSHLLGPTLN